MSENQDLNISVSNEATQPIDEIIKSLGMLNTAVNETVNNLKKFSEVPEKIEPIDKKLKKTTDGGFKAFKDAAVTTFAAVGVAVAAATYLVVSEINKASESYTALQKQFGNSEAGQAAFKSISQTAIEAGVNLGVAKDSMSELLAALNGDVESAANAFKVLAGYAAAGLPPENVKKFGAALSDLAGQNKVGLSDIQKFSKLGAGSLETLYKNIATSTGKSIASVKALAAAGTLSAQALADALVNNAPKIPPIDTQSWDNKQNAMVNKATEVWSSIKETFSAGFDSSAATSPIQNILDALDRLGQNKAVQQLATELGKIAGLALGHIPAILDGLGASIEFVGKHINTIKELAIALGIGATAAWYATGGLTAFATSMYAAISAVVVAAAPFIAIAAVVGGAVYLLIHYWDDIQNAFKSAETYLNTLPPKFIELGNNIINGLVEGIKNGAKLLYETVTNLGNSIKDTFVNLFQIHSPSKVFMEYGNNITAGTAQGIEQGTPSVHEATTNMVPAIEPPPAIQSVPQTNNSNTVNNTSSSNSNSNSTNTTNNIDINFSGNVGDVTNLDSIRQVVEEVFNKMFDQTGMSIGRY